MLICLDTIPTLHRQTDEQICHNSISLCMHCMLMSDKNAKQTVHTHKLSRYSVCFVQAGTSARQRGQRQSPGGISDSGGVRQYV